MRIRAKYVGSGESNLTTNNDYDVIGFARDGGGNSFGVVIDDNGDIKYTTGINNTATWDLLSVETVTGLQVYP